MLHRILGSRGLMSAVVVATLVLAGAVGLKLSKPTPPVHTYCADMPDSIGLYQGSAVTVMGVPVGTVTGIEPENGSARVRFTVRADRRLPLDVGAVTVSDTLVADRKLALIGDEPAGPGWDAAHCIAKTLTPKSLSETFQALAGLMDKLNGAGDPAQRSALGSGLDTLDTATVGSGAQINAIILQLSRALAAPDAAIGHVGSLLDALSELAHRARGNWGTVQQSVTGLAQTFGDIDTLAFPPIIELVGALAQVLPQANDAIMMFGSPALRSLNAIPDLARLIASGAGSLAQVISMAPAIAAGFTGARDPASGQLTIGYTPPKIALAHQDTTQVCVAVQALTGQRCQTSGSGAVTVPALPLLLAGVSAR
ncbi:MlaD family protein [Nocardia sp. NBC_00511]|uniref:MlaD family protein n=1 Tax=Nocardia sp. NBC_00511 TaxID=2903591 RepID=UPI0030E3FE9D